MLRYEILTIQHLSHRYSTVGDYYHNDITNVDNIRVSLMDNEKYEFLVALHEFVEQFLTKQRGIKEEDITKFDEDYEKYRLKGDTSEPGDCTLAPYYKEHQFATYIEKLMAIELGVDWREYEEAIIRLDEPSNTGC